MSKNQEKWEKEFDNKFIVDFDILKVPHKRVKLFIRDLLSKEREKFKEDLEDADNFGKSVECERCNDNGCPACDGTKGSEYNPEPY